MHKSPQGRKPALTPDQVETLRRTYADSDDQSVKFQQRLAQELGVGLATVRNALFQSGVYNYATETRSLHPGVAPLRSPSPDPDAPIQDLFQLSPRTDDSRCLTVFADKLQCGSQVRGPEPFQHCMPCLAWAVTGEPLHGRTTSMRDVARHWFVCAVRDKYGDPCGLAPGPLRMCARHTDTYLLTGSPAPDPEQPFWGLATPQAKRPPEWPVQTTVTRQIRNPGLTPHQARTMQEHWAQLGATWPGVAEVAETFGVPRAVAFDVLYRVGPYGMSHYTLPKEN